MFYKLNNIEWNKLSHAYGDASDVPELIEGLLSSDKKVFEEAIYELFGNIWHQGTVYEATPKAIPCTVKTTNPFTGKAVEPPENLDSLPERKRNRCWIRLLVKDIVPVQS